MKRKAAVAAAQSTQPFVPTGFKVPSTLATRQFRLRTLTVNDLVKDYDAVITSVDHLRGVFGPQSAWPADDLTLEQDLIDLGWHQNRVPDSALVCLHRDEPGRNDLSGVCVHLPYKEARA